MDTENPIHINIYKENKETINSSNNPTECYIIQVNDTILFYDPFSQYTGVFRKQ